LAFKGGKGVATALGSVLGLSPSIGTLLLLIWLGAVAIWRYSSGGALAAFWLFPVVSIVNEQRQEFLIFAIVVSMLIWIKHKDNIVRLWKGTEGKIGQKTLATYRPSPLPRCPLSIFLGVQTLNTINLKSQSCSGLPLFFLINA